MNSAGGEIGLVDMHCHVDLYPSPETVVAEAEAARVWTVAVTNAPSVFFHTRELCRRRSFFQAAVGLHPELVVSHGGELETMWPSLDETQFVGEIGLDYVTSDKEVRRKQQDVFGRILERCAEHGNKVLTVHSRRASADVIAMVGNRFSGTVILHWFSGPLKDLRNAAQSGMYFSVNPAMARSQSGQRLVAEMPRDRVLTETDGPFVKAGSRPARPPDVAGVVDWLATSWKVAPDEARQVIAANLKRAIAAGPGS